MYEDYDDEFFVISNRALKPNVQVIVVETHFEPIDINLHLDMYNDYMVLYQMFGDQMYLQSAESILNKLKYFGVDNNDTGADITRRMA